MRGSMDSPVLLPKYDNFAAKAWGAYSGKNRIETNIVPSPLKKSLDYIIQEVLQSLKKREINARNIYTYANAYDLLSIFAAFHFTKYIFTYRALSMLDYNFVGLILLGSIWLICWFINQLVLVLHLRLDGRSRSSLITKVSSWLDSSAAGIVL